MLSSIVTLTIMNENNTTKIFRKTKNSQLLQENNIKAHFLAVFSLIRKIAKTIIKIIQFVDKMLSPVSIGGKE